MPAMVLGYSRYEPVHPHNWTDRAACIGQDPELWFPTSDTASHSREEVAAAKAICRQCPVAAECLTLALATRSEGIWGGLTASERKQLKASGGWTP